MKTRDQSSFRRYKYNKRKPYYQRLFQAFKARVWIEAIAPGAWIKANYLYHNINWE